ncbi:hypothetical protein GOV10_06260, partial [Candidatus Woesearchaeota archaeon]|nr:hypothetical protein [Candidatus Woesearchaeota archaeon]
KRQIKKRDEKGRITAHKPTEKSRIEVGALVSFGHTQEDIAKHLHIDADTLAKHYREELDNAKLRANAQVSGSLFRKAVEQDELSAQIFWLKTQAGWSENKDVKNLTSAIDSLVDKINDK